MSLPSLVALPPSLLPFVSRAEESFLAAAGNLSEALAARCRAWLAEHGEAFARVCAASDFVSEQVSRDPQMLLQLAELGVEAADTFKTTHYAAPAKRSKGVMVKDAAELVAALKQKGLL